MNGLTVKQILLLLGKVLLLTFIFIVLLAFASQLSGISALPEGSAALPADSGDIVKAIAISSFLQVIALTYIILRSRRSGWKLAGAVVLAFYGSMTVIPQSESFVYLQTQLPAGMVLKLFIMGGIVTVVFSPIAVMLLGKMRRAGTIDGTQMTEAMSGSEWVYKLAAIVFAYLFLYYFFGYFVAWKNPAVLQYYGGSDPGSFAAQLGKIMESTPWMFPFQALRALLWAAVMLPILRALNGTSLEISLVTAFFLSVWSLQLLLPNPYMPAEVAHTHLVETVLSNSIFGLLMGWLFSKHHPSFNHLFTMRRQSVR